MIVFRIVRDYFGWHYYLALGELAGIVRNLWRFLYHFFSVPVIATTLFAPWHRLHEGYRSLLYPGDFFSSLIVNGLMRLLGFLVRTVFLVFSSLVLLLATVLVPIVFVVWLLLPFVFVLSLFLGLYLLFY